VIILIVDNIYFLLQQVAYVGCQMTSGSDRTHQACVEAFGVSYEEILQCVESDFATNQQLGYEQITTPVLTETNWVPTIVYNGKITEFSHTGNAPALKEVLCSLIHNTNPVCRTVKEF
jgi:hypothetical protein